MQKALNRKRLTIFGIAACAELLWLVTQPWRFLPYGTEFPHLFRATGISSEYGWYLLVLFGVLPIAWLASLVSGKPEPLRRRDACLIALIGGLIVFAGLVLTDWLYLSDRN